MFKPGLLFLIAVSFIAADAAHAQWPAPKAPVVPEADGYVVIPDAAIPPEKDHVYKAVVDASRAATQATDLIPALNATGAELNTLSVAGVPQENARVVVAFRGPAVDALLDDAHYKAKFGVSNPNLKVLSELRKAGVDLFVCGQTLAYEKIDPACLAPEVVVAADAFIVLIKYQNSGYALLSF